MGTHRLRLLWWWLRLLWWGCYDDGCYDDGYGCTLISNNGWGCYDDDGCCVVFVTVQLATLSACTKIFSCSCRQSFVICFKYNIAYNTSYTLTAEQLSSHFDCLCCSCSSFSNQASFLDKGLLGILVRSWVFYSWLYLCTLEYTTGIIPSYILSPIVLLSILLQPLGCYVYILFFCIVCCAIVVIIQAVYYHFLVLSFWCDTLVRKCLSQQNSHTLEWTPINSTGSSCPTLQMKFMQLSMVGILTQSHACVYVWLKHVVFHMWRFIFSDWNISLVC